MSNRTRATATKSSSKTDAMQARREEVVAVKSRPATLITAKTPASAPSAPASVPVAASAPSAPASEPIAVPVAAAKKNYRKKLPPAQYRRVQVARVMKRFAAIERTMSHWTYIVPNAEGNAVDVFALVRKELIAGGASFDGAVKLLKLVPDGWLPSHTKVQGQKLSADAMIVGTKVVLRTSAKKLYDGIIDDLDAVLEVRKVAHGKVICKSGTDTLVLTCGHVRLADAPSAPAATGSVPVALESASEVQK